MSPDQKDVGPTGDTRVLFHHHVDRRDVPQSEVGPLKMDVQCSRPFVSRSDQNFTDRADPSPCLLQWQGLRYIPTQKCPRKDLTHLALAAVQGDVWTNDWSPNRQVARGTSLQ